MTANNAFQNQLSVWNEISDHMDISIMSGHEVLMSDIVIDPLKRSIFHNYRYFPDYFVVVSYRALINTNNHLRMLGWELPGFASKPVVDDNACFKVLLLPKNCVDIIVEFLLADLQHCNGTSCVVIGFGKLHQSRLKITAEAFWSVFPQQGHGFGFDSKLDDALANRIIACGI